MRHAPSARLVFVLLTLVFAIHVLVVGLRGWYVYDDWVLLGSRRELIATDEVLDYFFRSHNQHLSATFIVLHWAITQMFGVNSYAPMVVSLLLVNILLVVVLRQLMLILGCRQWFASITSPLLLLWGPISRVLYYGVDGSFSLATVGVVIAFILVRRQGPISWRDCAASLVLILAIGSQSLAVLGIPAIAVSMLILRRFRPMFAVLGPPTVFYTVWFATYGQRPPAHSASAFTPPEVFDDSLVDQARFGSRLLSVVVQGFVPWGIGGLTVALVIAILIGGLRNTSVEAFAIAIGCLMMGLTVVVAISRSRTFWGMDSAEESRYVLVPTIFFFGLFVLGLQKMYDKLSVMKSRLIALTVIIGLVGTISLINFVKLGKQEDVFRHMNLAKREILSLAASPVLEILPAEMEVEAWSLDFTVGHLRSLVGGGLIRPTYDLSELQVLDHQARYLVRPEPLRSSDSGAGFSSPLYGRLVFAAPKGCLVAVPDDASESGRVSVQLSSPEGAPFWFRVTSPVDQIEYYLARGRARSSIHMIPSDGKPTSIRSEVSEGFAVWLLLPSGASVCSLSG